jgi:hypothetical protein
MKLNVDFIEKEDYLWVYQNCDIFKKYLYDYFDFRGKGLTHWAIRISANGHYIEVTLHKAPKLNKISWMTLNGRIGTVTNTINTAGVRNGSKQSKELDSIKEETQGTYFKDIMKIIKRDIKLKTILENE